MKTQYYHFFPTCPNCHEPHVSGAPIEFENDNIIKCTNCDVKFFTKIGLSDFPSVCNYLKIKTTQKMPLVWKLTPNCIENSYVDWINGDIRIGKYLITWPWKKVKFLPILATEYLKASNNSKVVIIGDINKNNESKFIYPHINEIFDNIIYSDEEIPKTEVEREIKTETNRFGKKHVLIKDKKTYFIIKRIGTGNYQKQRKKGIYPGSRDKCRNHLFEDLYDEYGDECIRTYKRVPSRSKSRTLNKNGIIDVEIGEREEWGGNLNFTQSWFFDVLFNYSKFDNIKKFIKPQLITEDDAELVLTEYSNLYLISDQLDPTYIFQIVQKLSPELVLIENIDDFIKDVRYGGIKSRELFRYLTKFKGLLLMFSTNPDARHLLNIGTDFDLIDKYGLVLHTWDSGLVIEKLKSQLKNDVVNPLSSNENELPPLGHKPNIEYLTVKELDFIDRIMPRIKDLSKNYMRFFLDLKKTPIYLKSEKNKYKVFKRRLSYETELNFDKVMIQLRRTDRELFEELYSFFLDNYGVNSMQKNPVLEYLINLLNYLVPYENIISIVVHGNDVKATELLLRENGFEEYFPQKINVLKWSNLFLIEQELGKKDNHIVISTMYPSLDYQLYFSKKVDKFIFLGSPDDMKSCKDIVEKRLTEHYARPLSFVFDNKKAPELLLKTLKAISTEEEIEIETDYDYKFELVENISYESHLTDDVKTTSFRHKIIKSGEEAILVTDNMNKYMFIPLNKNIFFKVEEVDAIKEIKIKKTELNTILNKEIIIDRSGVYTSFKHIFTKFMIEHGQIRIQSRFKTWDNFYDLILDSSEWIGVLRSAIKKIMNVEKISKSEAEEKLSTFLSELNLTARRKDYIKNWWSEPEYIQTEYGLVPVYDIEHTKSLEDMKKIYGTIKKHYLPELELSIEDAEKSYIAARKLQKMRRDFFKSTPETFKTQNTILYEMLHKEIKKIIESSESFKIVTASNVVIKSDVYALEIIDESKIANFIS